MSLWLRTVARPLLCLQVPQIQIQDVPVEVPHVQEVVRHVPVIQIQEVPYTRHVHVPKIEIQTVE